MKVKYDCQLWNGERYVRKEVEGEVIKEAIPPFKSGELAVQRLVDNIHPVTYHRRHFIVVHIATGASASFVETTRKKAIQSAKIRLSKISKRQVQIAVKKAAKSLRECKPVAAELIEE